MRRSTGLAIFLIMAILYPYQGQGASLNEKENIYAKSGSFRTYFSLNGIWKTNGPYAEKGGEEPGVAEKWYISEYDDSGWLMCEVPDRKSCSKAEDGYYCWYRKEFGLPEDFEGKTILLKFHAAAHVARVWLNGNYLGEHCGKVTPFQFEISNYINLDKPNLLVVRLYAPPYLVPNNYEYAYGCWERMGLQGKVECIAVPKVYIGKALVDSHHTGSIETRLTINNTLDRLVTYELFYNLRNHADNEIVKGGKIARIKVPAGKTNHIFRVKIDKIIPWSPQNPYLYDLFLALKEPKSGNIEEVWQDTIGFRTFEVRGNRFYLNGKPHRIHAVSWITGEGSGVFGRDIEWYKKERLWLKKGNVDFTRTHGGPGPENLAHASDEIGIMLLKESMYILMGQNSNGLANEEKLLPRLKAQFREMVERDYNRPSVVAWSLVNEMYNSKNIPLLNKLYDFVKSVDPYRPILTDSGDPSKVYFAHTSILKEFRNLKTDITDAHFYDGWYWGPTQNIIRQTEHIKKIGVTRPLITPEAVGTYLEMGERGQHSLWRRYLGEKRYMDLSERENYLSRNIKETMEYQRMHPEVYAGAMFFSNLFAYYIHLDLYPGFEETVLKTMNRCFSPVLICTDLLSRNCFSGETISCNLYAINDYQDNDFENVSANLKLTGSNSNILFKWVKNISLTSNSFQKFPVKIKIPDNASTGFYDLSLSIKAEEETLSTNNYQLFIMSKKDISSHIKSNKKVLLIANKKEDEINTILDGLSIKYDYLLSTSLKGIGVEELRNKLLDYDIFIIGPNALNIGFIVKGSILREFAENGGRILCLEQKASLFKRWVPLSLTLKTGMPLENSFVDIRDETSSLFKGLSYKNFDTWNGNYGIISDTVLKSKLPSEYVLAEAGESGAFGQGTADFSPVIINFRCGKGEYLISQLKAVDRHRKDPVATKYLTNLLEYFLTHSIYAKEYKKGEEEKISDGPFKPDKDGFIHQWLICGPFPNPGGRPYGDKKNQEGFDRDFFIDKGGEVSLIPHEGMFYSAIFPKTKEGYWMVGGALPISKIDCKWEKINFPHSQVDLSLFDYSENIIAYAACYIDSPEDMDVKLKLGSDDGYKLWLNHRPIGELNTCRGLFVDSNIHRVTLRKGMNVLLLKITQDIGGFAFCLRFTDLNDKMVDNLNIWLNAEK